MTPIRLSIFITNFWFMILTVISEQIILKSFRMSKLRKSLTKKKVFCTFPLLSIYITSTKDELNKQLNKQKGNNKEIGLILILIKSG